VKVSGVRACAHDRVVMRSGWRDAWLSSGWELLVGGVLLILSYEWFWETAGGIWQTWHNGIGTAAAVLGPWFI